MKILANRPTITRKELEGVLDCLISDSLDAGETVKNFEASVSRLTGVRFALATNSLTAAFHLVFMTLEIGEGSEIIMPSYSGHHALSALRLCGGTPVLVDCAAGSIFPDPAEIRSRITESTRAVVISHLFGYHFPLEGLKDLAIPLIEDISHAIGTEYDETPVGQAGSFAVASFNPWGVITTGNGGIVLTNNSKHYSTMRDRRGSSDAGLHYEYAMTDFQGAMGLSQMVKLPAFLARRREIARRYHESLSLTSHTSFYSYGDAFAYQSFPVLFEAPDDRIDQYWKKSKIEVVPSLPAPLHSLLELPPMDFPLSERLSKKCYSLPLYPTLSRKEIEKISRTLAGFI